MEAAGKRTRAAKGTSKSKSKSKNTGSSSRQQTFDKHGVPIPTMPNDRAQGFWDKWERREVKPTKFFHHEDMENLGVRDGLYSLFTNMGWFNFLALEALTYEVPTKEFLATMIPNHADRILTFQIQGRAFQINYDDINTCMGTPTAMLTTSQSMDYIRFLRMGAPLFWTQISGFENFIPSRQKVRYILHPCWRIAHRLLSTGMFGKEQAHQINHTELFFLHQMHVQNPFIPDFATFFIDKCINVRDSTGDICIGGFVTLIANWLGEEFTNPPYRPVGDQFLTINALTRMDMVRFRGNGTFSWLNHQKVPFYLLPSVPIGAFHPNDPETWEPPRQLDSDGDIIEYEDEFEEAEQHDQPMPDQPQFQPQEQPQFHQEPHFQQPGPELPAYFPPNFFTQFTTMFNTVENLATRVANLEEQQAATYREVQDMNYYHRHGHFPPRDPPV